MHCHEWDFEISQFIEYGARCLLRADEVRVITFDAFRCSMFGRNRHDGTTDNPVAPKYFAGGAACGSGVAVASGTVDFALGMYASTASYKMQYIKLQLRDHSSLLFS